MSESFTDYRIPPDTQHNIDVLVGERVYERCMWDAQTQEVVILRGKVEPIRLPFTYVKRWRPRYSHNAMGRAPWENGPRAFTIKPRQFLTKRKRQ